MGPLPPRARQDCDESGGVWRRQYGQENTADFTSYRANKHSHQLSDSDPMKPRSSRLDTWGRIGARSAT
jgi:hypothetical protein